MALPTYQANLDNDSNTAGVTLTWAATSVDPNDIIMLGIESSANQPDLMPTGYQLAGSYRDGTASTLQVFWRRATGDETGVTLPDAGDHLVVGAVVFRGCRTTGCPYVILAEGADEVSNTSFSANGGTTTVNDCLIAVWGTSGFDSATGQFSSPANADLGTVTLRLNNGTASGNGGTLALITGTKATAGSVGATTATLANNSQKVYLTLALLPTDAAAPSEPWVTDVVSVQLNVAGVTHSWSANSVDVDDIIVVVCETSGGEAVSIPAGYTEFTDSPQNSGSGTTTRLTAMWKRSDGTETGVTIADPGDHLLSIAFIIRGCHTSGDPYDVTSGGTETTADTSLSIPGATTTKANCLIIMLATNGSDVGANAYAKAWANADLTQVQGVYGVSTNVGNGGAIDVGRGVKAAAGSYGNSTATLIASFEKAYMTIAFKAPHAEEFLPRVIVS